LTVSPRLAAGDESAREIIGLATSIEANTECVDECRIGGLPPSCEALRLPGNASIARSMNSSAHDFVTVDMRGLKGALVARAQSERVSVSVVVRRAVERELGRDDVSRAPETADLPAVDPKGMMKLSIRLTNAEAEQLASNAHRAGLSRGAFLAGLLAEVPSLAGGSANRPDCLAALNASCAELSTLSRNLHHLTTLLRQGDVRAAQEYRRMLDTLGDDVRAHLRLAAGTLAQLRPARQARAGTEPRRRTTARREGKRHVRTA
jgi:hypothetical protein